MDREFTRRGLIEIGMAGASATLAPAALAATPRVTEGSPVGVAVVGLGTLSQGQILPALRTTKRARLVALVSGHADKARRLAADHGLPASAIYDYDGFDRIAADPRIDIVYIVLPNALHAPFTLRAFKAGKHVLCEKPMATNVADAEAMVAAGRAAGRKLMIAYRCHYEPGNLAAMRHIRTGGIGRPRLVVTDMGRQADLAIPSDAWRLDMAMSGGGALADMGIYGINAARYLLAEEPVAVRAWASTDRRDPRFRTVEDLIAWQFRFPSGALANGSTSFAYDATMAFQVWGTTGRIVADPGAFYNGNRLSFGAPGTAPVRIAEIDQFAREMDWMAEVVRGTAPMVSPGEEGVQDMKLMRAILASVAADGRTVATDWGYRRAVDPAAVVDPPRAG
ncbi:Gfo/Idh/MocA family protein [Sphingomonas morindae]|uniref:Gfo/Idh/MocA family oxidoreductase n=1 Tax=Sphingomonas morindae TaxID=1541170 RepID=A0ABY4X8I0_9SPHN|nr:Gfo/Idh/MocA family oxidoreductase [Sphingomonas morindae]USI73232.1 Gfo/Idh/MocA family oxidoreductase [Sphingomonas morindae]